MSSNKHSIGCVVVLALTATPLWAEEFGDFRAMWVSRFEYSTSSPASVEQVIANAANMGITDVLFQVRGKADAYYDSAYEPRAERLNGTWDPLQTAIDAAADNGVKLHAWINSMPIWRDTAAPVDQSHIFYNQNPSYRRVNSSGVLENPLTQNGEYASVNPLLPEVHTHLNNVVEDIATNYDVDGIHLDYIRWIGDTSFNNLPGDSYSHSLFQQATGLDASLSSNASAYRGFIKDSITDVVGSLKTTVDTVETNTGRNIDLSAAVWRDPTIAENERLQDYRTWLEQDLLDIAMPMIYLSSSNNGLFVPNLSATLNIPTNATIAPGLGAFLHDSNGGGVDLTVSQLSTAEQLGADGATFFSYSNFYVSDPLASQRRAAVQDFYANLAPVDPGGGLSPDANVLTSFDDGSEGYFGNSPTLSGSNIGINSATASITSSESHIGPSSQVVTIDGDDNGWFLRHLSGIGGVASPSSNLPLTSEGSVGFWMKTETEGVTVTLAVDDPGTADRGLIKSVIADGEWRLYEWDLSDDTQWEGWVTGDGSITGSTVTLDSIQFFGAGDAVIYLDTIAHNPLGSLLAPLVPGDYDGDGVVTLADFDRWRQDFGGSPTSSDGNSDGSVTAADYALLRGLQPQASAVAGIAVPEPSCLMITLAAATVSPVARRRRYTAEPNQAAA